jgi:hypothetical protein
MSHVDSTKETIEATIKATIRVITIETIKAAMKAQLATRAATKAADKAAYEAVVIKAAIETFPVLLTREEKKAAKKVAKRLADKVLVARLAAKAAETAAEMAKMKAFELGFAFDSQQSFVVQKTIETATTTIKASKDATAAAVIAEKVAAEALKRSKMHVRFSPSTKDHDGLPLPSVQMEQLALQYWEGKTTLLDDLLEGRQLKEFQQLITKLSIIILRIQDTGKSPLLPGGGGKALMLKTEHIPTLKELLKVIIKMKTHCVLICAEEKTSSTTTPCLISVSS